MYPKCEISWNFQYPANFKFSGTFPGHFWEKIFNYWNLTSHDHFLCIYLNAHELSRTFPGHFMCRVLTLLKYMKLLCSFFLHSTPTGDTYLEEFSSIMLPGHVTSDWNLSLKKWCICSAISRCVISAHAWCLCYFHFPAPISLSIRFRK